MERQVNQNLLDEVYNKFDDTNFDPYLLQNHKILFDLFNIVDSMTEWKYYDKSLEFDEYLSKKDSLNLAFSFFSSLNSKYKWKFMMDCIRNRLVQFEDFDNTEGHYHRNDFGYYRIDYPKNFNLGDFSILIHEYTHHISFQFPKLREITSSYMVYAETLSILSQLKSFDFLEENGILQSSIEIYKSYMRKSYQENINSFLFAEPLLDIYVSGEGLTEDKIDELLEINPFYIVIGDNGVQANLNLLLDHNLNDLLSYKHPLGMIKAASLHQDGISNKDFVELLDTINTVEVDEFDKMLSQKSALELAKDAVKEFSFKKKR